MNVLGLKLHLAWLAAAALTVPMTSLVFLALTAKGQLGLLSEKNLMQAYFDQRSSATQALYYFNYLPDSARFYGEDQVSLIDAQGPADSSTAFWLAVHQQSSPPAAWQCVLKHQPPAGLFQLYGCRL